MKYAIHAYEDIYSGLYGMYNDFVIEVNDEKEIQEYPVSELKFRPRKKKVKISEQELKELEGLEDKKGDSKLNG